jgi:hypothetical protein
MRVHGTTSFHGTTTRGTAAQIRALPLTSRTRAHGEPKELRQGSFIMRSGYSDVSWLLRAARVLPVIVGAALLGGMIGGFAVFAIDSALTARAGITAATANRNSRAGLGRAPREQTREKTRAKSNNKSVTRSDANRDNQPTADHPAADHPTVDHPATDALARCTIAR